MGVAVHICGEVYYTPWLYFSSEPPSVDLTCFSGAMSEERQANQSVDGDTAASEPQPAALSISLGESPPRGSSLLLCPAQWSALLEAAPVSLVVREMRDGLLVQGETDMECDVESEAEEKEGEKIPRLVFAEDDEIRTPLGGQTPDPDK